MVRPPWRATGSFSCPYSRAPGNLQTRCSAATTVDQAALIAALNQLSVQPPTTPGGEWVFDSGASSHMGSGSGITPIPSHHPSSTRIVVGNGSTLPITGVGSAVLPSTSRPLSLLEILISPSLTKNLVSVRAFTRDNSVSVEFDPYGFSFKDLASKTVLLRCDSAGDLYRFVRPRPCLHAAVTGDMWHQRLGHLGAAILARASSYYEFKFNKDPSHHCEACRLGKHTRLPFSSSTTTTSFLFELCHCDLWTSPVLSVRLYNT